MKKYISILILALFIIPSIAFASWWNPFTWKIFKKRTPAPQVQVLTNEKEKTPEEKITELQKQLDELKTQKSDSQTLQEKPVNGKELKKTTTTKVTTKEDNQYTQTILSILEKHTQSIDSVIKSFENKNSEVEKYLNTWQSLRNNQVYINQARGVEWIDNINDQTLKLIDASIVLTEGMKSKYTTANNFLNDMKKNISYAEMPKYQTKVNTQADLDSVINLVKSNDESMNKIIQILTTKHKDLIEGNNKVASAISLSAHKIIDVIEQNTSNSSSSYLDSINSLNMIYRPISCTSSGAFGVTYTTCY